MTDGKDELYRSAYPRPIESNISLRDYFAASAIQGLLADSDTVAAMQRIVADEAGESFQGLMAATAYEIADAMIKAR